MREAEYDVMRSVEDTYWWYRCLRRLVAETLAEALPETAAVLDAGCGTGGMLAILQQRQPAWRLHGVDLSPAAVAHCQQRRLSGIVSGSVMELPFTEGEFEAVTSLDVLYHAAVEEDTALREMRRVLRPGGWLVLNLPAFAALAGAHDAAVQGARRYTARRVREMLPAAEWELIRLHYWNAWLFLPVLAWRRLSRRRPEETAESDLKPLPPWLNRSLAGLAWADAQMCRTFRLPFGTSLLAVARKREN